MYPHLRSSFILAISFLATSWFADPAAARGFRPGLIPNGSENNCSNCHFNPGGGGARNDFGEDVFGLVSPGGREEFWSPTLAAEDSDNDGFTNGQEIGDIDGDGIAERTVNISLPGIAASTPDAAIGDCNLDTELDSHDLDCVTTVEFRDAVLMSLSTLPGDLDGNGDVAFADFLILSANFSSDSPAYTDGNIDLVEGVGFSDFLILSSNFGQTAASELAAVPEPSAALLCLLGTCTCIVTTRGTSRQSSRRDQA